MIDLGDLFQWAALVGFTAIEASVLLAILSLLKPPANTVQAEGTSPSAEPVVGFVRRFGVPGGWAICFGVLLGQTVLSLLPGGFLIATVAWWAVALTLFRLTIRQTFKANIALGLVYFVILLTVGALAEGR